MPRRRKPRPGGQYVAYPGKNPKPMNAQLTDAGRAILKQVKSAQMKGPFKRVKRPPSTGDVFEGLLRQFGTQLVLPSPGRVEVEVAEKEVVVEPKKEEPVHAHP